MTNNNHNSKNINRKNHKFDFFFRFSRLHLIYVNLNTFENKIGISFVQISNNFEKKNVIFLWWRVILIFFNSSSGPVLDNVFQTPLPGSGTFRRWTFRPWTIRRRDNSAPGPLFCSYVVSVCSQLRSRQDLGFQFQQVCAQRNSKNCLLNCFFITRKIKIGKI